MHLTSKGQRSSDCPRAKAISVHLSEIYQLSYQSGTFMHFFKLWHDLWMCWGHSYTYYQTHNLIEIKSTHMYSQHSLSPSVSAFIIGVTSWRRGMYELHSYHKAELAELRRERKEWGEGHTTFSTSWEGCSGFAHTEMSLRHPSRNYNIGEIRLLWERSMLNHPFTLRAEVS